MRKIIIPLGLLVVFGLGFLTTCDRRQSPTAEEEEQEKISTVGRVTVTTDPGILNVAPGQARSATVTAHVTTVTGIAVQGVSVGFELDTSSTAWGIIDLPNPDTTVSNGTVSTQFTSIPGDTGLVFIIARVGSHSGIDSIHIRPTSTTRVVDTIYVTASPVVINVPPGTPGLSTITAKVRDASGLTIDSVLIEFETDLGSVNQPGLTDENGEVTTQFNAMGEYGVAHVVGRVGSKSHSVDITINPTPFTQDTLILWTDTKLMYADNNPSTCANVTVLVKDVHNSPIPNAEVYFSTWPVGTTIGSPIYTDSSGIGVTQFDDHGVVTVPDSAMILVWLYDNQAVRDTIYIMIDSLPPVDYIDLTTDAPVGELVASGTDTTWVRATVYQRLPDGGVEAAFVPIRVLFDTDRGSFLSNNVLTDQGGVASVKFVTGNEVGTATLTAEAGGVISNILHIEFVPGPPFAIGLTANPRTINAGETSNIKAVVSDSTGNLLTEIMVAFETDLGYITPEAVTDDTGAVQVPFNAGAEAGVAKIKASVGNIVDSISVTIESGAASSITLSASPNLIQVAGTGGTESATLLATVYDASYNYVPDGTWVHFEIVSDPGGGVNIFIEGESDSSQTSNGVARATLNSGTVKGIVTVRAWTEVVINDTVHHVIEATNRNVVIVAGSPYAIGLNVGSDLTGVGAYWYIWVTAMVNDEWANPVQNGTAVTFTLDVPDTSEISIQGGAHTGNADANGDSTEGLAHTILTFPYWASLSTVRIIASCTTAEGNTISDTLDYDLPLVQCEVNLDVIPIYWNYGNPQQGDPAEFECIATLHDNSGNPISGVQIDFSSSNFGIFYRPEDDGICPDPIVPFQQDFDTTNSEGVAKLWLIAELQYTLDVAAGQTSKDSQVEASAHGWGVSSDPVNIMVEILGR